MSLVQLGLLLLFVMLGIISGLPIAFVFGAAGFGLLFITMAADPLFLVPSSISLMRSFVLLALPLYIIVGKLMEVGVLSDRLLGFIDVLLGRAKGMFGGVTVVFCAVFGAISGSAMSAIAAIGSIVIPRAPERGYPREYITSVIACSCLISMLIPPSIDMIVFGFSARLSVARCFLATAVPGILVTLLYLVINFFLTRKLTPVAQPPTVSRRGRELLRTTRGALTALMLPVIILGGIYGGVFTPTEAAGIAVVWIILDGLVLHRQFISRLWGGLIEAGNVIGSVAAIVFFVFMMSKVMCWLNVPDLLMSFTTSLVHSKVLFLLMANVLILLLGMIMDDVSICLLVAIILLPVANTYGVDPYHFAAIVGVNAGLANLTPPVAPLLYFAGAIGDVPVNKIFKTVVYYILFGHLPVLLLVTYIPEISLWLPNLWGGI